MAKPKTYICSICEEEFQIEYGDLYIIPKKSKLKEICDECADTILKAWMKVRSLELVRADKA